MKEQILLNGITKDIAPTLLAGYYKYGVATLITGNFGTSGGAILEIETMQELINADSNGISRTILHNMVKRDIRVYFVMTDLE